MPVRGKILNCLKADYERIFKSDIITDLIRVLGCGVEVQTKKAKDLTSFDLANLRWNKVIICTDADVDGYQIRTLILTMIYRLCPTLIEEGYVYIAESPLYEINCKDKTWFAYTEQEKGEILKNLEGKKVSINRSKGLGENDPEMMWMTTMNPETRRLIKVMPEDMALTQQVFDLLLGDNLQGRKDHIAENGYKSSINWMCRDMDDVLQARVRALRRNMTKETKLWIFLRSYPAPKRCFLRYVDFYAHQARLAIELDGSGHYERAMQS